MTDNRANGRANLQESIKDQHKQSSLHPADPDMLTGAASGKGYSQNRIEPEVQTRLSREQAGSDMLRPGEKERSTSGWIQRIVPFVITFVLGILVTVLIFRTIYAPSSDTNEGTAASAGTEEQAVSDKESAKEEEFVEFAETDEASQAQEEMQEADTSAEEAIADANETAASDAIVEIPDPVLKKVLQDALGIGDREITEEDALSLTGEIFYDGSGGDTIKDLTGLSAFTNLDSMQLIDNEISDVSPLSNLTNMYSINLCWNEISDLSPLSNLTNLTYLGLGDNQISDISALSGLTNLEIIRLYENQISDISPLSGLTNLTELSLDNNQISDISALSSLTNLEYLWLEGNPVIMNMSWEEIMEVLSGAEGLTYVDF